jgi:hypothetical protein
MKFLNFDNNQSMFTKNQNLYLIIYIMFVSQALRNLPRQKTASVTFRKNINMYVTPEKIKDALRALPPTIIGHSPESWSVEEPEKTYPAIKLVCNRVIHESEIVCRFLNKKQRLDLDISI